MANNMPKRKKQRKCRPPFCRNYKTYDLQRMHLTRRQHTAFLACPNFRYLQHLRLKKRKKNMPNWRGCLPMFPISCSAMNAEPSERTVILAAPHVPPYELERRKNLHDNMLLTKEARRAEQERLPEHYVRPSALDAKLTKRVQFLSYPKYIYCDSQMKELGPLLGKEFVEKMFQYIQKSPMYIDKAKRKDKKYETFHIRSHKSVESMATVSAVSIPQKPKFKPLNREEYEEWLKGIATAKEVHKPPPRPKKKRVRIVELLPRIKKLATPLKVYEKPDVEQFFKVKHNALVYRPSDRIKEISKPRVLEEEYEEDELTPSGVKPKALHAIATPGIIKLAKAIERKSTVEEEYEFAFKVKPEALKARCTKRMKELARPVER